MATSRIEAGSRPAARAASWRRARTAARLTEMLTLPTAYCLPPTACQLLLHRGKEALHLRRVRSVRRRLEARVERRCGAGHVADVDVGHAEAVQRLSVG